MNKTMRSRIGLSAALWTVLIGMSCGILVAEAHIVVVGGAGNIGDVELEALVAELAQEERTVYARNLNPECIELFEHPQDNYENTRS